VPYTFFIVYKQTAFHASGTNDAILDGTAVFESAGLTGSTTFGSAFYAGGGGAISNGTEECNNVYGLIVVQSNGASSFIRANGAQIASGNPGTANPGGITLGCQQDGTRPASFLCRELFVYNSALSLANVQAAEAYVRRAYALW
jgi:hypothetical protein